MVGIYKNQNRGIYKIINIKNGKSYVGSTSRIFGERWCQHKTELNNNKHSNCYLQNAWNKYGKENFVFVEQEVLNNPELTVNQIREREQYWIDNLKPEYNLSDVALYGEMTNYGKYRAAYAKGTKAELISPEGIHYCSISLAWFAEDFNLQSATLQNLCNGKIHHHKKWKGSIILEDGSTPYLFTQKARTRNYYHLVSPEGIHMCTENIREFCKEYNLSYAHLVNVCNPTCLKRTHHKKWTGNIIIEEYKIPTKYISTKELRLAKDNLSNLHYDIDSNISNSILDREAQNNRLETYRLARSEYNTYIWDTKTDKAYIIGDIPNNTHLTMFDFCKEFNLKESSIRGHFNKNRLNYKHLVIYRQAKELDLPSQTFLNNYYENNKNFEVRRPRSSPYIYTVISPNNKTYTLDKDPKGFCEKYNLDLSSFSKVAKGKLRSTKG